MTQMYTNIYHDSNNDIKTNQCFYIFRGGRQTLRLILEEIDPKYLYFTPVPSFILIKISFHHFIYSLIGNLPPPFKEARSAANNITSMNERKCKNDKNN